MNLTITFKSPDALHEAISEAINREIDNIELDADVEQYLRNALYEKYLALANKWIRHGEYVTVTIFESTGECQVIPSAR